MDLQQRFATRISQYVIMYINDNYSIQFVSNLAAFWFVNLHKNASPSFDYYICPGTYIYNM